MSCPYFYPAQPLSSARSAQTAMLPLGDLWNGQCRAAPLDPREPDRGDLRPLCNLGYARGNCARFPSAPDLPDAVRFTISADQGSVVRLYFVIERDHHPFAHGSLEYSSASGSFSAPPEGEILRQQAVAYVTSYLSRKADATAR